MTLPRFESADVRRYYDRHTGAFARFGQGGGALHRAVWGPGVRAREEAFHHVEDRIAELIGALPAAGAMPHVVDLGCGVGASMRYLAERLPIRATGITLSPVQARLATGRIRDAGLDARVSCIEGDYSDMPSGVAPADLAYAIESFVHATSPARALAACARLVRADGLLIICDDFRRSAGGRAAERAVERFCRGWHVNALLSREELRALAHGAGFELQSSDDLSPHLEMRRPRDRAIAALDALAGWFPPVARRFDYLIGGSALQQCLARGWIGYDFSVFRRNVATTG